MTGRPFDISNQLKQAEIYFQLGEIRRTQKKIPEAISYYRQAIRLKPDFCEAYHSLGVVLDALGEATQAIACYQQAVGIRPDFYDAYFNLGNAYAMEKNYRQAILCYEKVIQLVPDFSRVYLNLGGVLKASGNLEGAIACFHKRLDLSPDCPKAYVKLGNIYAEQGNWSKSAVHYQEAIRCDPKYEYAYYCLGNVCREQGRLTDAIENFKKAVQIRPAYPEAFYNMGNTYAALDKLKESVLSFQQAIRTEPNYFHAYHNLGNIYRELGRIDESVQCFRKTIEKKGRSAEAHVNLATSLLLLGRLSEGWKEYEWRIDLYNYSTFKQPKWNGKRFKGQTLFVYDEQGFGDTLQFCRYLPLVKSLGGNLIFEVRKPLAGLFKDFQAIDLLLIREDNSRSSIQFDQHVPLMSIPHLLGTVLENIPSKIPYLFSNPAKVNEWKDSTSGKGLRVGIVWEGSRKFLKNKDRSSRLKYFEPLFNIEGATFFSLQKQVSEKDRKLLKKFSVRNLGVRFNDFSDTAAALKNMDLLISTDTSVPHLAGALGTPVWLLLSFVPDWRWLLNRDDCPWYPSMRLFRQKDSGDWEGVILSVCDALRDVLKSQGGWI